MEETEQPRPTISVDFLVHDLVSEATGIDVRVSVASYTYLLTRALEGAFADADPAIFIGYAWNGDNRPSIFQIQATGFPDDAATTDRVDEIARQVREAGEWVIPE